MTDDRVATEADPGASQTGPTTQPELQDLQDTVDDLMVYLHEAKSVPLSGNAIVDREQFLGMLERLRAELPDELRAARWMVREREAFIARTNEKAREIVDKARDEADELVSESNITKEAVEEANILVRRAEGEARRLRLETEDEIEKKLQAAEGLLAQLLAEVKAARSELHQARPKPPDVPV
jgi:cell division septum initiation protein DivIVA